MGSVKAWGTAAFARPMGDFFGGPKNEVRIDHVLIQNLRPGADGFSSLREDRRPLDQGVRKMGELVGRSQWTGLWTASDQFLV